VSQPFNLRVILGKASSEVLQEVFSRFPAYEGFNWSNVAEGDVEPILQHLKSAGAEEQRRIGIRLRQIHALGSAPGTRVLLKAGVECGLATLGADLRLLRNAYGRAFWCLAKHEALFDHPRVYAYTHSLPKDARETRVGFPQGKIVITEAMVAEVARGIQEAFRDEDRAALCWADHREHEGVHLIHAYPSDYIDEIDTYVPDGRLSTITVTPPFHIVYYLDESAGTATVLAKGGSDRHEALFNNLADVVFGISTPLKAGKKTYDLAVFKNPNHEFLVDPTNHFSPPRVIKMLLQFPESRRRRAHFEVDANDPHDDIYRLLQRKLVGGLDELARCTILRVEVRVIFRVPGEPEEAVDFKITVPRWCTLEYDGKDGIIRRHLRPWGIENDGKREAPLPGPALVA
jgi:hypothetical protein